MMPKISSLEEYHSQYKYSTEQPEQFWAGIAETFQWRKKWNKVLEWDFTTPDVKWFVNGKMNITENVLDRHLPARANQTAIIWEPNNPNESFRSLTYSELHEQICRFADVLTKQGVKKGDSVCVYMPMVPELTVAILACARIGAVHSVVFAGFSSRALSDRIQDADAKIVVTADGFFRGEKNVALKDIVDEALNDCPLVTNTIVLKRSGQTVAWNEVRDVWWHDLMNHASPDFPAVETDSEDPLFILYTSGSTGKPKGIVHTCGGYMVYVDYSFRNVFQYNEKDIYWCTADVGWVTGHSYIIYGPLLAGATTLMFEGIPTYPDAGRFWDVVDKHQVNIFYTAPTAIRSLEAHGTEYVYKRNLSTLKVLGTVGEPINVEAWEWYYEHVGKKQCPIVDTWWQTETGGIMISPLTGITPTKPGYATLPLPGIQPCLMDEKGNEITDPVGEGRLCIKFPWPSMARTIRGDHERFRQTYFSTFQHKYFTGDGCRRDADGYYRITGRVDDIIIVSGHNLGTAEIENAIDEHEKVCETAVVGYPHAIKGNAIYAYVILFDWVKDDHDILRKEINNLVTQTIGAIARPEKIQFVRGLPKTRSGKIMRRILRKIAENDITNLGDTSTLLDPTVVDDIKANALINTQ
jgi:acetyl-CoA synthetase